MKKILALLLAAVMLCGMIATASAAEFTDAGEIDVKNTEAVTVLSGLGIIGGMGDGTFQPNGTLTRAQAAKIIAYMLLGKDGAEALPADTAAFDDVPTSHWSCKYVNYCAEKGIVSGVGNNKFNPNGTLTGFAFGKMLLVSAAGFNAEQEGLVGSSWESNVSKLLKSEDLTLGVTVSSDGLRRQDACHLALNTLFYGEADDPYSTLAYKTFKVSRMGGKGKRENYFRPSTIYSSETENAYWEGTEITVDTSPLFVSLNGEVTGGKLYTAVNGHEVGVDNMVVYRNGNAAKTEGVVNTIAKGSTDPFEKSRVYNGTSLEVYYDATDDFFTFIILGRRTATVTEVTPAVKTSDGTILEQGLVTLDNGLSCVNNELTAEDVGKRVFTWGVSKTSWNDEFSSLNDVTRGKIVTGTLQAASGAGVTVDGKTYVMPSRFTKTTGQAYLDGGGAIGDTVNIFVSEYNLAYDIWQ